MKKLIVAVIIFLVSSKAFAQTTEEVIDNFKDGASFDEPYKVEERSQHVSETKVFRKELVSVINEDI